MVYIYRTPDRATRVCQLFAVGTTAVECTGLHSQTAPSHSHNETKRRIPPLMVRFFEDYNGSAVARTAPGARRLCMAIE